MENFLEEYTRLAKLGEGSYAQVFKVRHNDLGYIRAVRVLKGVIDESDKLYNKFMEHCRLLLRLGNGNHPNIVHIYQPLLKNNQAFVEMDYVDGKDLQAYLEEKKSFVEIDEVMKLLTDIGSALAYCHEDIYELCYDKEKDGLEDDPEDGSKVLLNQETRERLIKKYGVVHNDIHSRNIMRRKNGMFVLLDFGLAIDGEKMAISSTAKNGDPQYMAPEKAKWEDDNKEQIKFPPSSDIYSFGIVLYEFLAGRVPFKLIKRDDPADLDRVRKAHANKRPEPIYEFRKSAFENAHPGEIYEKDYPDWLETLIMKCLEKDPNDRFRNGKELFLYAQEHLSQGSDSNLYVLKTENENLRNVNKTLGTQITTLQNEIQALKNENIEFLKEGADALKKSEDISCELSSANKDKENLKTENENLRNVNKTLGTRITTLQNEIQALENKNSELLKKGKSDASTSQSFQRRIQEIEKQLSSANKDKENLETGNENLRNVNKTLGTRITTLQNEIQALENKNSELLKKGKSDASTSQSFQRRIQEIEKQLNSSNKKLEDISRELSSANKDKEVLKKENEKLCNTVKELRNTNEVIGTSKGDVDKLVTNLQEQLKDLFNTRNVLRTRITTLQNENQKLKSQNKSKGGKVWKFATFTLLLISLLCVGTMSLPIWEPLSTKISSLNSTSQSMIKLVKNRDNTIVQLKGQIQKKETQIDDLLSQVNTLKSEISSLKLVNHGKETQIDNLSSQVNTLKSEISILKKERTALRKELLN